MNHARLFFVGKVDALFAQTVGMLLKTVHQLMFAEDVKSVDITFLYTRQPQLIPQMIPKEKGAGG